MSNAEYQEMLRLEGDLSSSVLFKLKSEATDWDDYLRRLRATHKAVCEAIDNLCKGA